MNDEKIHHIIHEITKSSKLFNDYAQLLLNPQMRIDNKKLSRLCVDCAKACIELRNQVLEKHDEQIA